MYSLKSLAVLPRHILLDLSIDPKSVHPVIPLHGRKFLVTSEKVGKDEDKNHYREIFIKEISVSALASAIATKFKRQADDIAAIYKVESMCLVQVEDNDQVWNLDEGQMLNVSFKA